MLAAIGVVTALAAWDSRREAEAILSDLGQEQSVVAVIVARDLRAHLAMLQRSPAAGRVSPADLLGDPVSLEQPGEFRLLLLSPDQSDFIATDGTRIQSPPLRDALEKRIPVARLTRDQAAVIGLLPRTAVAGLTHVEMGLLGDWGVVAVTTAARPRDREARAFWRLVLSVALAAGLVLAFGGAALRTERRELETQRELTIATIEHQRDEQLARAERVATMGTFAMGVVHEVSTPLGVIMGRAEQLRARAHDDERSVHAAGAIIAQVDRIQLIIRRFLDMARGGRPSLSRIRPADLVQSVAASVQHRFNKASVALVTDLSPDIPEVLGDRPLLEQALVNLLLNACDACAAGGQVELAVRSDAARVAFVVTDNGVGIAVEDAARVMDPFFTTKGPAGGTGLGLAIASEIAKSHRGELSIGSQEARGTRACLEIPAALDAGGGRAIG